MTKRQIAQRIRDIIDKHVDYDCYADKEFIDDTPVFLRKMYNLIDRVHKDHAVDEAKKNLKKGGKHV